MSEQQIRISLPLDDKGFLRRECPYCIRQFKMKITEEERNIEMENLLESYLTQSPRDSDEMETEIEKEIGRASCRERV